MIQPSMAPRLRYPELAPEGIAHMRALEHYLNATTALPAVLLELVRLRVSLQNGCSFCTGHHKRELEKHHEPQSRIEAVQNWIESDAFTPRERAALNWADAVTEIQTRRAGDAEYEAVSAFFEGKDLVDLTLAIASINAWNRMSIAFGAEWDPTRARVANGKAAAEQAAAATTAVAAGEDAPMQDAVDDDGGKVAQE